MKLIGYQIYSFGAAGRPSQHDWQSFGGIMYDIGEAKAQLSVVQSKYEGLRWEWKIVGLVDLETTP